MRREALRDAEGRGQLVVSMVAEQRRTVREGGPGPYPSIQLHCSPPCNPNGRRRSTTTPEWEMKVVEHQLVEIHHKLHDLVTSRQ